MKLFGKQIGGDDREGTIAGIVATPAAYALMDLEHEGHVLFSDRDDRGRMAWPTGAALRSYIDADAPDEAPRPYVLLSGSILRQAQLPLLPGYSPTREAIEAPFNDRVAEVQRAPAAYNSPDPLANKILLVALGLSGVLALVVIGIFAPQFTGIVRAANIPPITIGIVLGAPVLAAIAWLFWERRGQSKDGAATPTPETGGEDE